MRKVLYLVTMVNILFQMIYMSLGDHTTSELGILRYIFYVFRPEYMIVSGVIAFLVGCGILILIIKSIKNTHFPDIVMLLLNIEYIIYYLAMLTKQ